MQEMGIIPETVIEFIYFIDSLYLLLSFHSGNLPGVYGAPYVSSFDSTDFISLSIDFRFVNKSPNLLAAASYDRLNVVVGAAVVVHNAPVIKSTLSFTEVGEEPS